MKLPNSPRFYCRSCCSHRRNCQNRSGGELTPTPEPGRGDRRSPPSDGSISVTDMTGRTVVPKPPGASWRSAAD